MATYNDINKESIKRFYKGLDQFKYRNDFIHYIQEFAESLDFDKRCEFLDILEDITFFFGKLSTDEFKEIESNLFFND